MKKIEAYECSGIGCRKAFKTKTACQKHELTCFKHKDTKTCSTCAYAEVYHNNGSRHPKTVCRNQFFSTDHFTPAYKTPDCSLNINCSLWLDKDLV